MKDVIQQINQFVHFNTQEAKEISSAFRIIHLKKGEYWIKEGSYVNTIAYIQSGSLRIFYNNETGEEVTCHFSFTGQFIASYTSS